MDSEMLNRVVEKVHQSGHVFVATADRNGVPHLAAAKKMTFVGDAIVDVAEWFCPGTMENLKSNPNVSLVVWDAPTDSGYQLVGRLERVEALAVMDGYAPEIEEMGPSPQVEHKLVIRVDRVYDFRHAPHSDLQMT